MNDSAAIPPKLPAGAVAIGEPGCRQDHENRDDDGGETGDSTTPRGAMTPTTSARGSPRPTANPAPRAMLNNSSQATATAAPSTPRKTHAGQPDDGASEHGNGGERYEFALTARHRSRPRAARVVKKTPPRQAGETAKPPLALLEGEQRLEKIGLRKVRPQGRAEIDLRISDLPQQEVGDPLFARGADQQIEGTGVPAGVEVVFDPSPRRPAASSGVPAGVGLGHRSAHQVGQLLAARVVEGDLDQRAGAVRGRLDGALQLLAYGMGRVVRCVRSGRKRRLF